MRAETIFAFVVMGCLELVPRHAPASVPSATDQLFQTYATPGSTAIVAAVVQNGRVVYQRAFGEADLANAIPATLRTVFEIGSVSKMFTALTIERLIHDGRLASDDDVRKFIPGLPEYEAPVIVQQLLQHTSGVRVL
jgi:CubicO group peptidase (beta-lactamase class C family)